MKTFKRLDGQDGFTLLELLVVVAILATIGGAVIGTFGNQEENAAQGTATNSIAALENSLRVYEATQGQLPNELESLVCRPYDTGTGTSAGVAIISTDNDGQSLALNLGTDTYKIGGSSNLNGIGGGLGFKLGDKFDLLAVNVDGLMASGISSVRYAATLACDATVDDPALEMGVASGVAANEATIGGTLADISIPNHMFEAPRTGTNRNRGRGFSHALVDGQVEPLMVWKRGTGGYNNVKIGAGADDVLVGLGIGQASTLVGTNSEAMLAKAPFYGQIARDKYAHYIALVKIGTADDNILTNFDDSTAQVVALIDARGDFLDEEIAEFTDQKQ